MKIKGFKKEQNSIETNFFSIKNIVIGLLAILTAYNTFVTTKTKGELEVASMRIDTAQGKLSLQTTELNNLLKKKEFENNVKMKMYDEAKLAIGKDSLTQAATLIIINEMLKDDSAFLWQLKSIISRVPNIRNAAKAQSKLDVFAKQERSIPKDSFTIDVFYLDEIVGEALPRAKQVVHSLKIQFPKYKIRLRLLPASINSQSGYRIGENVIRYEKSEANLAKRIREIIDSEKIFPLKQLDLQLINNRTPKYISIFVRNM